MVRDLAQRSAHARRALRQEVDAWVATASRSGRPHLVPLSFAFDDPDLLMATPSTSVTASNLEAHRACAARARRPARRDRDRRDGVGAPVGRR